MRKTRVRELKKRLQNIDTVTLPQHVSNPPRRIGGKIMSLSADPINHNKWYWRKLKQAYVRGML